MTLANSEWDVAIVGGGPVGSTVASLLRRYDPGARVVIIEKDVFPREHVGESQLPSVAAVLDEMGVWDKVEAADFPIKIGASLTWGSGHDAWDFDFFPAEQFVDEPRPGRYEGQRARTAFQVDRAIYDDILLRHAESMGAAVHQDTRVERVRTDGDRIEGLELAGGGTVTARHYVDGSGAVGLLRRALDIPSWEPQELRNIAIYDYWDNTAWAFQIGVGATRVLVRSLPYGWIWFIPLGPTRTSIGLICPSEHYRASGQSPEDLYRAALAAEPEIASLIQGAAPTGTVRSCKDWSHVAERVAGPNWFIAGEAAGFADPILAAGLAIAHSTAREVAYTILELDRGTINPEWLRRRYDERTRTSIRQHVKFAQYWYSANGQFGDLAQHCKAIAREAGLRLSPEQAWRWLAQGGFINHGVRAPQIGSFDVFSARHVLERLSGKESSYAIEKYNVLQLNLHGAEREQIGELVDGRIELVDCWIKGERTLPVAREYENVIRLLEHTSDLHEVLQHLQANFGHLAGGVHPAIQQHLAAIETMIADGWIIPKLDRRRPLTRLASKGGMQMRSTAEGRAAVERARVERDKKQI